LRSSEQLKGCVAATARHYYFPGNRGCSSVVEHLLANESGVRDLKLSHLRSSRFHREKSKFGLRSKVLM
jgi:hypothetical protein